MIFSLYLYFTMLSINYSYAKSKDDLNTIEIMKLLYIGFLLTCPRIILSNTALYNKTICAST